MSTLLFLVGGGNGLFDQIVGTIEWLYSTCTGLVLQTGYEDLWSALRITAVLVGPLWIGLQGAQAIGLDVTRLVCRTQWFGATIPGVIGTVLQLTIGFFALKFVVRSMLGLASAGTSSPDLRDAGFTLVGVLVPALATGLLRSSSGSLAACLFH